MPAKQNLIWKLNKKIQVDEVNVDIRATDKQNKVQV